MAALPLRLEFFHPPLILQTSSQQFFTFAFFSPGPTAVSLVEGAAVCGAGPGAGQTSPTAGGLCCCSSFLTPGSLAWAIVAWIKFKLFLLHSSVYKSIFPQLFHSWHLCPLSYSVALASLLLFTPRTESMQQLPCLTASPSFTPTGSQITN